MRHLAISSIALAGSFVQAYVVGGHPRPVGIPQTDTFDTLGIASAGTPTVFEDGPFVGGLNYADISPNVDYFILQTFGVSQSRVVVGGIVPHSRPNVATLPHPGQGRIVALGYAPGPRPCTNLQSSYIACSVVTYNTVQVLPVAVPIGCKVVFTAYDRSGTKVLGTQEQNYVPSVAIVNPGSLGFLATGNIIGFLETSPITSAMQRMDFSFPNGTWWKVEAEILDSELAIPTGLPKSVTDYLNTTIYATYQDSIQLHLDDVVYTAGVEGCQGVDPS